MHNFSSWGRHKASITVVTGFIHNYRNDSIIKTEFQKILKFLPSNFSSAINLNILST